MRIRLYEDSDQAEKRHMVSRHTSRLTSIVSRRDFLRLGAAAAALGPGALLAAPQVETPPDVFIGYTELRTNLPGGRHANVGWAQLQRWHRAVTIAGFSVDARAGQS